LGFIDSEQFSVMEQPGMDSRSPDASVENDVTAPAASIPRTIRVLLILFAAQALACQAAVVATELQPTLFGHALINRLASGFAQGQIVLSFVVLAAILYWHCRWRWLTASALIYGWTLAAEVIGVSSGLPFGSYRFTHMLGVKWFGVVPVLIPLAWFNIAVPAYVAASAAFGNRAGRILAGASLMLAWDLCTDPLMGHRYAFWIWRQPGTFYGIPVSNFAGWFLMGLFAMAFLACCSWTRADKYRSRAFIAHYAVNLFAALGLLVILRMTLAVLVCGGLLLALQAVRRLRWALDRRGY
jgi:uncharacterized membrane protein